LANQPVGQHFPASPGDDVDELTAVQVDDAGGEHRRVDRVGTGERRLIHTHRAHRPDPFGALDQRRAVLDDARALICGCVSVQVCCSHSTWVQRQTRLIHTNVTAR
jgi:hypothetical protein